MSDVALFPVIDGHNDMLLRFTLPGRSEEAIETFFTGTKEGHIDLPRARQGGFAGGMFAVYVPARQKKKGKKAKPRSFADYATPTGYSVPLDAPLKYNYALKTALTMTAGLFRLEAMSEGQVKVVRTVDEFEACLQNDTLAAVLHFEGAEPIDRDLVALDVLYQAGLRSLGIVWSRPTIFAEGVPFVFPHSPDIGGGLTDAGRALVKACNQLGIMLDLSHLNEAGFWDVAKYSEAPLVATHSNVHALCPLTRNLTDKQLDAIKESDGMVGLNFGVSFLRADGMIGTDVPLETMVRHIDYLVERVGIDRVGFGSDFDGTRVSEDLKDVAGLPNLVAALRKAGYNDGELRKITHQNWLRVLRKTWKS
ncbi:MAG: membrane dipeptidase [Anaerolineaceae bacterium]|nr:membrane dipeptidase [Anaerolineaceae bacterium]